MTPLTVWVFVATVTLPGIGSIDMADELKYAFTSKKTCEQIIAPSTKLKCIELKLVVTNDK